MNRFEEALEYFKDQAVAWSGTKHEEKYKAAVYALKLAAKLEQDPSDIAVIKGAIKHLEMYPKNHSKAPFDIVLKAASTHLVLLEQARNEIE